MENTLVLRGGWGGEWKKHRVWSQAREEPIPPTPATSCMWGFGENHRLTHNVEPTGSTWLSGRPPLRETTMHP